MRSCRRSWGGCGGQHLRRNSLNAPQIRRFLFVVSGARKGGLQAMRQYSLRRAPQPHTNQLSDAFVWLKMFIPLSAVWWGWGSRRLAAGAPATFRSRSNPNPVPWRFEWHLGTTARVRCTLAWQAGQSAIMSVCHYHSLHRPCKRTRHAQVRARANRRSTPNPAA